MFGGIDFGFHGDHGPNGSKGSPVKAEEYLGYCVTGHSHTPGIKGRSGNGGTTSITNPGFVKGKPGSWGQGCILGYAPKGYDLGSIQLINIVRGEWKVK